MKMSQQQMSAAIDLLSYRVREFGDQAMNLARQHQDRRMWITRLEPIYHDVQDQFKTISIALGLLGVDDGQSSGQEAEEGTEGKAQAGYTSLNTDEELSDFIDDETFARLAALRGYGLLQPASTTGDSGEPADSSLGTGDEITGDGTGAVSQTGEVTSQNGPVAADSGTVQQAVSDGTSGDSGAVSVDGSNNGIGSEASGELGAGLSGVALSGTPTTEAGAGPDAAGVEKPVSTGLNNSVTLKPRTTLGKSK